MANSDGLLKESLAPGMESLGKARSSDDKRKVLNKTKKVRWPGTKALSLKKTKGLSEDKPNRYQRIALSLDKK